MPSQLKFSPIITTKNKLNTISIVNGQYIVVTDTNELYLDKNGTRKRISQSVTIGDVEPDNPQEGDIWFVTVED